MPLQIDILNRVRRYVSRVLYDRRLMYRVLDKARLRIAR